MLLFCSITIDWSIFYSKFLPAPSESVKTIIYSIGRSRENFSRNAKRKPKFQKCPVLKPTDTEKTLKSSARPCAVARKHYESFVCLAILVLAARRLRVNQDVFFFHLQIPKRDDRQSDDYCNDKSIPPSGSEAEKNDSVAISLGPITTFRSPEDLIVSGNQLYAR